MDNNQEKFSIGLSCYYHDSAVALMKDDRIISALQEERFSRIKQDKRFPGLALQRILVDNGIKLNHIDKIFYYENPEKKFSRIIETYSCFGLKGVSSFNEEIPLWFTEKKDIKKKLQQELATRYPNEDIPVIEYIDHHHSHAASAFYPSPFQSAAVLCIDGVGEWATTSAWQGNGQTLKKIWEIKFPHSLGLLYSAFTWYCGFKVDSGEYKLMGLAPYGTPIYVDIIKNKIIKINNDGSFILNMKYFDYPVGNCMVSESFGELFGHAPRKAESILSQHYLDMAASIQAITEEVVIKIARHLRTITGEKNLCMAGGVALNCVANGKIAKEKIFDNIWIQPAAGDSGGAIGALYAGMAMNKELRRQQYGIDLMAGAYLGTAYNNAYIKEYLDSIDAVYHEYPWEQVLECTVSKILDGNVIGWFQDRMEFGPRALGNRSIIGDPRNSTMQSVMNLKIKNRESFRPFAPIVMEEYAHEWFDIHQEDEYMLFVTNVAKDKLIPYQDDNFHGIEKLQVLRSQIPAVTHVDNSARVQVLYKKNNSKFHDLLAQFYHQSGCPVLINTSFNVRGEPIVESPHDAYKCFMRTKMDILIMGNIVCIKSEQPPLPDDEDWQNIYTLD
ncbi:putative carbamoyltransferase protein [Xenorhabdus nematophila ATCC 19061]|uniref:Carbamoyltransferase protein n=1 Tax=Xenorhabdus nematophila (strain ATCC 19061 / DSM 3370 / CCUG 14189 / LMG 1036 / NCIMB 9965 / AN6) TaxID=406817 RepID=D3V9I1_XENNA|nr:carbamoyltransferase [Xenorhabdus nematophila]CBJ91531.1 putative carbamoyltransferase protein [Xenorhabdus nematophila ATCC 19061]CEK24354.1 putative carbamoyltransferase protein [Xenorhabdus nematophila AN6/1]